MTSKEELKQKFLDIWADSHNAKFYHQIDEYEDQAWQVWDKLLEEYPEQYDISLTAGIEYLDWESTGYKAPYHTMWRCNVFKRQREAFELALD